MLIIQNITDAAKQKQTVTLPDQTSLILEIEYKPMQLGWFITNLQNGNFTLQGTRIVASPNMLRQFKHQITFGLACFTTDRHDPTLQQDFLPDNRATLYILTADEVQEYEDVLSGKAGA